MLTVTLYEFKKRENSTKRPDASATQRDHRAVLKMPTSLLSPEITFDFGLKGNPSFYNYAYISDLGNRYYFIRDWTVSEGHLWTAHMEVDVLASWKNSIGESTQYVIRSSHSSDGAITDSLYPARGNPTVSTEKSGIWPVVSSISGGSYVVGIVNNSPDAIGAVAYYVFSAVEFRAFMEYLMGDISWAGTISDISEDLLKVLFNPMQYVTSVMWYPDNAPAGTKVTSIPFGWWTISVSAKKLRTEGVMPQSTVIKIPKHPQSTARGKYLNASPYSQYIFDSRVWGVIPIDTTALLNADSLVMTYTIDFVTGISDMYLEVGTTGYAVAIRRGQYGVPIQIAQIGQNYLNMAITAVNSGVDMAKNFFNPLGEIKAAANAIGDIVNASLPQFSTTGSNGTVANFTKEPTLYAKFMPVVNEDNADKGRPYCTAVTLSTIPGYQMISNADLDIAGTSEENRKIKNYMESGYFYE